METFNNNTDNTSLREILASIQQKLELNPAFKQIFEVLFEKCQTISDNLFLKTLEPEIDKLILLIEKSTLTLKHKIDLNNSSTDTLVRDPILIINTYYDENELNISEFEKSAVDILAVLINNLKKGTEELKLLLSRIPDYPFIEGDEKLIEFKITDLVSEKLDEEVLPLTDGDDFKTKYTDFKANLIENVPLIFNKSIIESFNSLFSEYFKTIGSFKHLFNTNLIRLSDTENENSKNFKFKKLIYNYSEVLEIFSKQNIADIKIKFNDLNLSQKFRTLFLSSVSQLSFKSENTLSQDYKIDRNILSNVSDNNIKKLDSKIQFIINSFYNGYKVDRIIDKIDINIYFIFQELGVHINRLINESIVAKNNKLILEINTTIGKLEEKSNNINNLFETIGQQDLDSIKNIEKLIEDSIQKINVVIKTIPEKIELIENIDFINLNIEEINESQSKKILIYRIIDELVSSNLITCLNSLILELSIHFSEIDINIQNHIRLIKFSIFRQTNNQQLSFVESQDFDILQFLNQRLTECELTKINIDKLDNSVSDDLLKSFQMFHTKLNLNYLKSQADNLGQYIPKKQAKKGISVFKKFIVKISKLYDKLLVKFWSHQSDAIIIAEDVIGKHKFKSQVNSLLNSIEPLLLSNNSNSKIPFYYKQLFLDRTVYNKDFWIGRSKEIEKAQIAYNRFNTGIAGGLLITGDRFSGKSYLINYLCNEIINSTRTIIIDAPDSGVVDLETFLEKVQEKSGLKGNLLKVFSSLEKGTTVVFEDIELWWEKSEKGNEVIQQITELIELFGNSVFFIASISTQSFLSLEKTVSIQNQFLDIVFCKPVNSEALQDIIQLRHQISGLKFSLIQENSIGRKRIEESFKTKNFANLFSKYFNYSNGNIGICLLAWIANIIQFDNNRLIMKLPELDNIPEFNNFNKDEILLLYILLIHKKMDISKLSRVLIMKESEVKKQLELFTKSKLITQGPAYEINPFINHIVVKFLQQQDII